MPYPYIMLAYPLLTRNCWHFINEKLEQVTEDPGSLEQTYYLGSLYSPLPAPLL